MGKLANDAYPTPQKLADAIVGRLREHTPPPNVVIEPSCGRGAFVRAAAATWPGVPIIGVDIVDYSTEITALGAKFVQSDWAQTVKATTFPSGTLIIGNPPYSNAQPQQHIEAALDHTPPGTRIAYLLRLAFLGGTKRAKTLWSRRALKYLIPVAGRPKFDPDPKAGSDHSEYGVFVFETGHCGYFKGLEPLVWNDS